jgi:hypothetical protein
MMAKQIGWQSPLFYLQYKRASLKSILYSIKLWLFHYNKNEHWTFIRVFGFYRRKFI